MRCHVVHMVLSKVSERGQQMLDINTRQKSKQNQIVLPRDISFDRICFFLIRQPFQTLSLVRSLL